jgi:excisionase family DNA binding protein
MGTRKPLRQSIAVRLDSLEKGYMGQVLASKRILTAEEGAQFLDIAVSYLYKLTSAGVLPYSKPAGKKIYFLREDLERWVMGARMPGAAERKEAAAEYLERKKRK